MTKEELDLQLAMNYNDLVQYLLQKHGVAKYDYFCTPECRSKNKKLRRTNEGLFCHHIDEDKASNLSQRKVALESDFSMQKAERLVYCSYLEHLLLHIKIFEEYLSGCIKNCGFGLVAYFIPELNFFYENGYFENNYPKEIGESIKEDFENYIVALKYLWGIAKISENDTKQDRIKKATIGSANALWQKSTRVYNELKELEPLYCLAISKKEMRRIERSGFFTDVFLNSQFVGKEVFLREEKNFEIYGKLKIVGYKEVDFNEYKVTALKTKFLNLQALAEKNPTVYRFFKYYVEDITSAKKELNENMVDGKYSIWAEYYGQ